MQRNVQSDVQKATRVVTRETPARRWRSWLIETLSSQLPFPFPTIVHAPLAIANPPPGLHALFPPTAGATAPRRAIHVVGSSVNTLLGLPSPADVHVDELLTVVLVNSPAVHPFNMNEMGRVVMEKTRRATREAMEVEAVKRGEGWWFLEIDCS